MAQGFTRPAGSLIIGATSVSGGTANRILYEDTGPVVKDSANLKFDGTDFLLGSGIRARMDAQNRFRFLNTMVRVYDTNPIILSPASGVPTAVTFNSESYDTDGMHSTSVNTSRLTAQIAGKYLVHGTAQFAFSAAGNVRGLYFYKNGSFYSVMQFIPPTPGGANGDIASGIDVISLAANDYVELFAFQDSGGTLGVLGTGEGNSHFGMAYIGE